MQRKSVLLSNSCGDIAVNTGCKSAQDSESDKQMNNEESNESESYIFCKSLSLHSSHQNFKVIDETTIRQLHYAKAGVDDDVWQLFWEEGEMKMFKTEFEIDGLIQDPLKATHLVKGITAREYTHYFFGVKYKSEWDDTVENVNLVEKISDDTVIIHQTHKRIWPTAQRESLFWSHLRQVDAEKDDDALDLFMVCNHDCQRDDVPLKHSSNIRVGLNIAMVCQTIASNPFTTRETSTRDDISCRVIYVAQVNPGGILPKAGLRLLYKREYPKFLREFTDYVSKRVKDQSITY